MVENKNIVKLKKSFFYNSISLTHIAVIIAGFCLIVFGGVLVNGATLLILFNTTLPASTMNGIVAAAPWIGFTVRIVPAFCIFVYVYYTTRFKVDPQSLKRQIIKLSTITTLILCVFVASSLIIETPIVRAETASAVGGYLATPFAEWDYLIGKHSATSYFGINGSDWNDLTAVMPWQAVPTWLSFTSNVTALQEQALASTTYGVVYLKENAFNYSVLNIPVNVAVVENVNGRVRTFINNTNTEGSPYTISVGVGADVGYYFAQDSADRYIDSWSSTNSQTVFNNVLTLNPPHVYAKSGAYSAVLAIPAGCSFTAENGTTGLTYASIGNGAKIDEPTFNAQFRGYDHGTYTISTNGTNILAFKPDNSIYYLSTNASYVFNTVNAQLATVYGLGFVRDGDYSFDSPFKINSPYVTWEGDTIRQTILRFNNADYSAFQIAKAGNALLVDLQIRNFYVYFTGTTTGNCIGFDIINLSNSLIENTWVDFPNSAAGIGMQLYSPNSVPWIAWNTFRNNYFSKGTIGLSLFTAGLGFINKNVFEHPHFYQCGTGLYAATASGNGINKNDFYNPVSEETILAAFNLNMTGGNFYGGGAIDIPTGYSWSLTNAVNNNFYGTQFETASVSSLGGSTNKIYGSPDYFVENHGPQANTTATTVTWSHGLSQTPIVAYASFNDTGITGYAVTSITSSQVVFTIQGTPTGSSFTAYCKAKGANAP